LTLLLLCCLLLLLLLAVDVVSWRDDDDGTESRKLKRPSPHQSRRMEKCQVVFPTPLRCVG
jgi:hypothetical protein